MKKIVLLLIVMCFQVSAFAQGEWIKQADFPVMISNAVGFSINGKGYVCTGTNGTSKKETWEYDPVLNAWTQKADFKGSARHDASVFVIDNKAYVAIGKDDNYNLLKDMWQYDPGLNTWTQKADFPLVRYWATALVIHNKGYVGMGVGESLTYPNDFWAYDPATDKWTKKADFPIAQRYRAAGFCIADKGYVTGTSSTHDIWEYDPAADTWTEKTNPNSSTGDAPYMVVINGKAYSISGTVIKEWNPVTNVWTAQTNFPEDYLYNTVAFSIGNKAYFGTGYQNTSITQKFYSFEPNVCPTKASFIVSSQKAYKGHTITFTNLSVNATSYTWLLDGKLMSTKKDTLYTFKKVGKYVISLIAKDVCADTVSQTIDVADGGWAERAILKGGAREGAAGFALNNKGYIATGSNKNDVWEWDPATNAWTQKANFPGLGRRFCVGFAIKNKGYVGTGLSNSYTYLKDFWEYDPIANAWTKKADFGGTAREHAAGFAIGDKGYICTGYDSVNYRKDFWEYNTLTDQWVQLPDFPGDERYDAVAFSIGKKGYLGTGKKMGMYNDFWEWNPATGNWSRKMDYPKYGQGGVGFELNGKGVIGTGNLYNNIWSKEFYEYDTLANTWTQMPGIGHGRMYAVGFSIKNKAYVATGVTDDYFNQIQHKFADLWEYNPNNCGVKASFKINIYKDSPTLLATNIIGKGNELIFTVPYDTTITYTYLLNGKPFQLNNSNAYTFNEIGNHKVTLIASNGSCSDTTSEIVTVICPDKNTKKANLTGLGRGYSSAFSIGINGYIVSGGYDDDQFNDYYVKDVWEYNTQLNTWTQKADFPGSGRLQSVGFSIGNKGYVGTGASGINFDLANLVYKKDFWEFDPASNNWTQKADFGGEARRTAVGFSIGNKGYIGTGNHGSYNLKDFWEYDPTADSWTKKADFPDVAKQEAVGFSIGNMGYIGTGTPGIDWFAGTNAFWQYNPANNTWARKADFPLAVHGTISLSTASRGYILFDRRMYEYRPNLDLWIIKDTLINEKNQRGVMSFTVGNKGYYGLGLFFTKHYGSTTLCEYAFDTCSSIITELPEIIHSGDLTIFPNPYTGSTNIRYTLQQQADVILEVYSILGQKIETLINTVQAGGEYNYVFSAKDKKFNSGVYFVQLTIEGKRTTKKIIELD